MEITLHNKDFYGVKIGEVKLKFVNEKLEEVYLQDNSSNKFNPLIKELEREFGKAYNVIDHGVGSEYKEAEKELAGKGITILVQQYTYTLYVKFKREE